MAGMEARLSTPVCPAPEEVQDLRKENRDQRKKLWHAYTRMLQLEQSASSVEERCYFAQAEKDRLEDELRRGRLREDTLAERLSRLRDSADRAREEKQRVEGEARTLKEEVRTQKTLIERATAQIEDLQQEAIQYAQEMRGLSAALLERPLAEPKDQVPAGGGECPAWNAVCGWWKRNAASKLATCASVWRWRSNAPHTPRNWN